MVKADQTLRDRIGGSAGFRFFEQVGEAICSMGGRHPRRAAQATAVTLGLVLFTGSAVAQDFCNSNPGELLGFATNTAAAIVVSIILLAVIGGAALRSAGLRRLGNALIGGVCVGVLTLVAGVWFTDTSLAYVPGVSMDAACGGVGG